jgi:two-component sensor histidine kinase
MTKLSDAALRLYCDKLAVLRRLCTRGLDRVAPDHDEQAVNARLKRVVSYVRALRHNVQLFELGPLDPTLREFEDLVRRIAAAPWSRASAEALIGRLNVLASEVGTVLEVRKRALGGDGATQRRDAVVATLQGQWLASLVARTLGKLARRDGRRGLAHLFAEYQQAATAVGREDLAEYVARYDAALQEMATAAGKQIHQLTLHGDCRFLDRPLMLALNDAIYACLRNAVEHGIEPTHRRSEIAKEPRGNVHVEARQIAGFLVVSVRDDGRGIDPAQLARRYVERGFATAAQVANIPPEEQLDWVFLPGLSLADGQKRDAGRGFGLELVRQVARNLGGDARVKSTPTKGTEIIIHVPLPETRLTTRLTLFNVVSAARATVAALQPLLARVRIDVEAAAETDAHALVLADRVGYLLLLEELLIAASDRAPAGARLRLEVVPLDGMANVQSQTLGVRLGVYDANGLPSPLAAPIDVSPSGYFGELMLESGLCPVAPCPAHEVLFYLPGLPTRPLLAEPVPILALTADWQATLRAFGAVAQRTFLGVECALFGPEQVADFRRAVEAGREAIVAIDPVSLGDKERMQALGAPAGLTVVAVVADAVASLPHKRLLELSPEPILVYGAVDEDAATLALEECLRRKIDGARQRRALAQDFDLAA